MTSIRSSFRFAAVLAATLGASATLALAAEPQPFSYETYDDGAMVASRGVSPADPVVVEQEGAARAPDRAATDRRQPARQFLADETRLGADIEH